MKKSIAVRVLCLAVASVVLTGAVAVAAVMGSPYETLKRAVLDAVTYRNVTLESSMTVTVNGEPVTEEKSHEIYGDAGSMRYYFDQNGDPNRFSYFAHGLTLQPGYTAEDGTQWYYANVYPRERFTFSHERSSVAMISPQDRDSSRMRFMELVADALIGDLKNNITMSSGDGVRLIRGTLTESQVPELAKVGLDMLAEQSGGYHY